MIQINQPSGAGSGSVLLAYPFRPFFLLTGLYGAVAILGWLGVFFGGWPLVEGVSPIRWHVHEVLFGWIPAAIAGFLLTAMCNWTGAAPLQGRWLGALAGLWLAGRAAMWSMGVLPPVAVAVIDLAFLPVVAMYAGRVILAAGSRRNLVMVAVLALLFAANLMVHLDFIGAAPGLAPAGERMAVNLILLLMVVIGGRITPLFTANWLARQGMASVPVRSSAPWDRLAIAATALMIPADWLGGAPWLGAGVALLAALANTRRLAGWSGWRCGSEPLVWVLHLGYAWIAAALWLKGLTPLLDSLTPAVWLHAAGAGAMGTMVLGVMTRVALGHTGRALQLPRGGAGIYYAITLAAVLRVTAAAGWTDYRISVMVSGLAWAVAFVLFLLWYWPILSRPRVDGRPG